MSTHRELAEMTVARVQGQLANGDTSPYDIYGYLTAIKALLAKPDDQWTANDIYRITLDQFPKTTNPDQWPE